MKCLHPGNSKCVPEKKELASVTCIYYPVGSDLHSLVILHGLASQEEELRYTQGTISTSPAPENPLQPCLWLLNL